MPAWIPNLVTFCARSKQKQIVYVIKALSFKMQCLCLLVQVNLCQKLFFSCQLTHNVTTDCSLNYEFSTWKLQAQNMMCTWIVLNVKTKTKNNLCSQHVLPMFYPCSELGIFMYWTGNSMNNLLSHCGLVDAKIRASDKDLPVLIRVGTFWG